MKYSREENPTVRLLERCIALLEGTEDALAFTSGMATISTALIASLEPGSKVVVPMGMYSTTLQLLNELASRIGVRVVRVRPSAEAIAEAVDREVSLVLTEVMTNPTLKLIDLEELQHTLPLDRVLLIVDNTFITPVLVQPARYGASLMIHSTTKYLSGHNDAVGGAVACSSERAKLLWEWRRMLGTIQPPFESYLVLRGMKTLEVRFERQSRSALTVAEFLLEHPRVGEVMYPGLRSDLNHDTASRLFRRGLYGAVLSFVVKGGREEALKVMRRVITPAPSLGGAESLITMPAVSAAARYIPPEDRRKLGIVDGLLRLSVGLEDPEDLIEDLSKALEG